MMRVGIIGAMDVEVTSIKERMTIDKIEQVGDNTYFEYRYCRFFR